MKFVLSLGNGIITVALLLVVTTSLFAGLPYDIKLPPIQLPAAPATFCLNGRDLLASRQLILAGDPAVAVALAQLRHEADQALRKKLVAVTDKTHPAPSGDHHDYVSLSTYFWPNPQTPDGLPYVLRDGQTNPEIRQYDSGRLGSMSSTVRTLTLAYYLTGDPRYADPAVRQIRRWFLDPVTRMNPNLKYGQLVRGMNQGSRWGIIDTASLIWVVEADALLQSSPAWTASDHRQLQQWIADYLIWLRTSDLGVQEASAPNNHGSYYDLQVAEFALFTGQRTLVRELLENVKTKRIARQIEPDGSQPLELSRTKSFDYSVFNLRALFYLARLGEVVGVDLWNYQTADGRGLRRALDFMTPFATGARAWPYPQIVPPSSSQMMAVLLRQAGMAWANPVYEKMIDQVPGGAAELSAAALWYPPLNVARRVAVVDRERIFRLANQALTLRPPTITDLVATNSPGGLHDFFSQADYAWPNPTNQTGLPYVTRDGESNPHTFTAHRLAMRHLKDAVAALAAAYLLKGDDHYAAKAADLLRVFFLDEATRMNPNLACAQVSLGQPWGTQYGIIDTLHLCEVAQAIPYLEKSPAFPSSVDQGLKQWFASYTRWILTSTNGVKEMNGLNNHSIACFLQLACFAKCTGDEKGLALARHRFKDVLLPNQMANNGSFPRELARTKPFGYSIFQADNLAALCAVLSTPVEDFWRFTLPDGRTPRQAVDFIYPYLTDKSLWLADGRKRDIKHWEHWPVRQPCLLLAYAEFGDEKYFALWQKLDPDPADLEIRRNLAVTQPLLWVARPAQLPLLKPGME